MAEHPGGALQGEHDPRGSSLCCGDRINVFKIAPESLMAYEQIKRTIQGQQKTLHVQEHFVAGLPGWCHIPNHHLPTGAEDVADPSLKGPL